MSLDIYVLAQLNSVSSLCFDSCLVPAHSKLRAFIAGIWDKAMVIFFALLLFTAPSAPPTTSKLLAVQTKAKERGLKRT